MSNTKKSRMNVALLRKVQRHILEEPRRLDMAGWGCTGGEGDNYPACGTVGCIAGWAIWLSRPNLKRPKGSRDGAMPLYQLVGLDPQREAARLLRLSYFASDPLFHTSDWPGNFYEAYMDADDAAGRAQATSDRIDHFIKTKGAE